MTVRSMENDCDVGRGRGASGSRRALGSKRSRGEADRQTDRTLIAPDVSALRLPSSVASVRTGSSPIFESRAEFHSADSPRKTAGIPQPAKRRRAKSARVAQQRVWIIQVRVIQEIKCVRAKCPAGPTPPTMVSRRYVREKGRCYKSPGRSASFGLACRCASETPAKAAGLSNCSPPGSESDSTKHTGGIDQIRTRVDHLPASSNHGARVVDHRVWQTRAESRQTRYDPAAK